MSHHSRRSYPAVLNLNRRDFLGRLIGATALPLLAACSAPAPSAAGPTSSAAKPVAAGTPATAAAPATAATAPAGQPKSGGSLRASFVGDITNIDGHYYSPKVGLATWIIFDTLTRYDDNLKVQPMLAESWEQSTDARQLTLNLRKGVMFHNGRELTTDDVVYNFTRVARPQDHRRHHHRLLPAETTFEAPDKYTVVVKTKQPWPAVFDLLEVVEHARQGDHGRAGSARPRPVGTGPFVFEEWVQGDHLTLHQEQELLADRQAVSRRDRRQRAQGRSSRWSRSWKPARSTWHLRPTAAGLRPAQGRRQVPGPAADARRAASIRSSRT